MHVVCIWCLCVLLIASWEFLLFPDGLEVHRQDSFQTARSAVSLYSSSPRCLQNFPCAYFSRYRGTIPLSNPTVFEEWHGGALPQMYANSESSTSCLECSPKIPITHFPSVIKDCMSFSLPLQEDCKRFSQLSPWLYLMSWLSPLPSLCASAPGAAGEPRRESGLRVFGALVALRQSPLYLPAKATRGRLKQRTARVVL